jgi:predicted nucleotide-binding protein (sugar kinase/HSP70/actin superfamily)
MAKSENTRTVYIPLMCDHAYPLAAAFRNSGVKAEVLPESNEETLEWGRKYSSGKECYPFIVTLGDLIRKAKEPGFDAKTSAFLMPSANGPCRFGQYNEMHRIVLKRLGYGDVEIFSPDSRNSYSDFGGVGPGFERLAWQGMVAVDIVQKLVWETRPYEKNPGDTDRVYQQSLDMISGAVESESQKVADVMPRIRELFDAIPVDKSERRPIIGAVGEIFLRSNAFSNSQIIRKLEDLGAEVWVAPFTEWVFYVNNRYMEDCLQHRRYLDWVKGFIKDRVQKRDEHQLAKPVEDLLLNRHEPGTKEVLSYSAPYMHHSFGGEAILSIGKAIDYVERDVSGIVNIMPFSCLPGMVVTAISKKFREDFGGIPWLNMTYDGQEEAGAQTRLEAFVYQVNQYRLQASRS